jgi:hypothetical protein
MTRAERAYKKMMDELFKFTSNPTYELCGITIENLVGKQARLEMMWEGLIKYVGKNHNGLSVYQIRQ